MSTATAGARMRFSVDAWDPTYGTSTELEGDLLDTSAAVDVDVEMPAASWRGVDQPVGVAAPSAILFVDGVRRVDARVWIDEAGSEPAVTASAGLAASYAAGVVCCCTSGSHLLSVKVLRGLFVTASHAADIATSAGTYQVHSTPARPDVAAAQNLSLALQQRLGEAELLAAAEARGALRHAGEGDDLLVIDGPLRGRTRLPACIGFIKTHRTEYLPSALHAMVGRLTGGQRTPVFLLGTSWDRHTWYLKLPCAPGAPWAGVVRVECGADMPAAEAVTLANLSQTVLCRYASTEYKDPRAPQNLYPIGGLERELRRRLGDARLLLRALRTAAVA